MQQKQQDILNTQLNVEKIHKENSSLIEKIQIDRSPLIIIRTGDKWFLALGNKRISEPFNTMEEVLHDMQQNPWDTTLKIIAVFLDTKEQFDKTNSL